MQKIEQEEIERMGIETRGIDPTGNRTPAAVAAARALLASPGFTATSLETEREIVIFRPRIAAALEAYAAAYGSHPQQFPSIAASEMSCAVLDQREEAADLMAKALEIEIVLAVREALTLAGVTEDPQKDDICRRVLDGD